MTTGLLALAANPPRGPRLCWFGERSALPGFGLTFGFTLAWLCLIVLIEGKIAEVDPLIDVRIVGRNVPPAGRAIGLRLRRARLFPNPSGTA